MNVKLLVFTWFSFATTLTHLFDSYFQPIIFNFNNLTGQSAIVVWTDYVLPRYRLSRTQTFATFSVLLPSPMYKYAPLQHPDETRFLLDFPSLLGFMRFNQLPYPRCLLLPTAKIVVLQRWPVLFWSTAI
jgi:hypothetical protein